MKPNLQPAFNKLLIVYSFIICLVFSIAGVVTAKNPNQLFSSFIFVPMIFLFGTKILFFSGESSPKPEKIKNNPVTTVKAQEPEAKHVAISTETVPGVADNDKRLFLKLIGTTSVSLVLMSIFTKKAQASFFGSAPVTQTVSVKNIAGKKINPAEKNPTDGYAITNIDQAGTPVYYGFVNNAGAWYIMSQDDNGEYLYAKGDSDFSLSWDNRNHLTFDYFNTVFSQ